MPRCSFIVPIAVLAALLSLSASAPVAAQSIHELREENRTLRTELADVSAELKAALARIDALNARIAELEAAAAGGATRPPRPAPSAAPSGPVSIDESRPGASPRSLHQALIASYDDVIGPLEFGEPGDATRKAFSLSLQRWAVKQERNLRLPIEWTVRITKPAQPLDRTRVSLAMQAVDPKTGTELGRPFTATMTRSLAARLARQESRIDLARELVIKGTAHPKVMLNEQRVERGAFDHPPFIGPYAEFDLVVEITSVNAKPVNADEDADDPATDPGTDGENPAAL